MDNLSAIWIVFWRSKFYHPSPWKMVKSCWKHYCKCSSLWCWVETKSSYWNVFWAYRKYHERIALGKRNYFCFHWTWSTWNQMIEANFYSEKRSYPITNKLHKTKVVQDECWNLLIRVRAKCWRHHYLSMTHNYDSFLGIPIRSTLDNSTTVQYAGLIMQLTNKARSTVSMTSSHYDVIIT